MTDIRAIRKEMAPEINAAFRDLMPDNSLNSHDVDNGPEFGAIPYPALDEKAFHGLAGIIVSTIDPHTESDPVAVLIQNIAAFGCLVGRGPHFRVGADYHSLKINPVLVGASGSAGKGRSLNEVKRLMEGVESNFRGIYHNGLSSGEGLISLVRDRVERSVKDKKGEIEIQVLDEGSEEKRAFIIEPEFARLLKVMGREQSTLSAIIRDCYDSDRLNVATKTPLRATGCHVVLGGHITPIELRKSLTENDQMNGFANRFVWPMVMRSKYLPDGGALSDHELNGLISRLRKAYLFSLTVGEMKRGEYAKELWHKEYRRLVDGYDGLLGAILSRAPSNVMRMACIYALLDMKAAVQVEHLEAALALWRYCADSAKYIFGMSSGDRLADKILELLRGAEEGLTRTDISNALGRHFKSERIDLALEKLSKVKAARKDIQDTGGRPREVWIPCGKSELCELSETTIEQAERAAIEDGM